MYAMPVVALIAAFLMVSRIPYRRFYRAYLLGRQPFGHFVVFVLLLAVSFSFKAPALVVIVSWYVISGPIFLLARRLRERYARAPVDAATGTADEDRRLA